MFGRRPDASLVRDLSPLRRFMPFVSPRRSEALVYMEDRIEVEAALALLDTLNQGRPREARATLFHLVLAAVARMLHDRPVLNRFVAGDRFWQRDGVYLTFSAKQRFDETAPILTVKRRFEAGEPFEAMCTDLLKKLGSGRGGEKTTSDREMGVLLRLPPFLVRLALGAVRLADRHGLLPRGMIETDPLYTSCFVANLGSLGLNGVFHHLWEWGNCPLFLVMGRVDPGPNGRRLTLSWTYDERIADGFYAATGLTRVRALLEAPAWVTDGEVPPPGPA